MDSDEAIRLRHTGACSNTWHLSASNYRAVVRRRWWEWVSERLAGRHHLPAARRTTRTRTPPSARFIENSGETVGRTARAALAAQRSASNQEGGANVARV